MTKNQKIYTTIGIIVVVLALIIPPIMAKFKTKPSDITNTNSPDGKMVTGSDIETFSGVISAVDTGCFADATCSVTIDGKKIILVTGGRSMSPDTPVGRLIGVDSIGDLEGKIGAYANVYAGLTAEGDYTLYGNNNYYVEITTTSGK